MLQPLILPPKIQKRGSVIIIIIIRSYRKYNEKIKNRVIKNKVMIKIKIQTSEFKKTLRNI